MSVYHYQHIHYCNTTTPYHHHISKTRSTNTTLRQIHHSKYATKDNSKHNCETLYELL
jgi:hypothetical protein